MTDQDDKIPCPACGKPIKVIKVPCKCPECGAKLVIEYRPILPREWFE